MLTVITGLPGAGKTLYTLQYVDAWAKREGRPVYYSGIKDLQLPWIELENPEQWYALPAGSIVVVDEAQRHFRPRGAGSAVPRHVSELETHRHIGIDVVLITQHPMLLDQNVRRLTGRHFHVMRNFGLKRSTVHEWTAIKDDCGKSRKDSVRHEWSYPRQYFSLYKSAELHTHKARVPMRVFFLLLSPFIIGALGYVIYHWGFGSLSSKPESAAPVVIASHAKEIPAGPQPVVFRTTQEYLDAHAPRIEGLAYTAPIYDQVTQPVRAPFPSACAVMKGQCRCYTKDATRLDMPQDLCVSIVDRGFFRSWKEEEPPRFQQAYKPLPTEQPGESPVTVIGLSGHAYVREQGTRSRGSVAASDTSPREQGSEREPDSVEAPRPAQVPLSSPSHFNNSSAGAGRP